MVTVCPPRGSNTAMNVLLDNIGRVNFTDQDRQELLIIAKRVFIETPNRKHAKQMMEVLSIENMRSILEERESLPELDKHNVLRLKFEDLNGSYLTPGFRDPKYDGDFYSRNHSLQIFLEIPRDVLMQNNLLISVQTEGNWSYLMKGSGFQANHMKMNFSAARNFCLERGGNLASVISKEESEEIVKVAKGKMWLGGKRNGQSGTWNWLDGRLWDFENWYTKSFYLNPFGSDTQPSNKIGEDCIAYSSVWGWYDEPCNLRYPFICQTSFTAKVARPPISASGDKILSMLEESTSSRSTFQFLWNFKPEQIHQTAAGFKLKNGLKRRMIQEIGG